MNRLPPEILDMIISHIEESECRKSERFPTLTAASKRGILSAREVWCAYRKRIPLRRLFVRVLEEHPFVVSGPEGQRGWISGLDALSRSEYAYDIVTLSFCLMIFKDYLRVARWPDGSLDTLATAVSRFPILEHIRYYTLPASYAKGVWCSEDSYVWNGSGWEATEYHPRDEMFNPSKRPDTQAAEGFARLQLCFANDALKSLTMRCHTAVILARFAHCPGPS